MLAGRFQKSESVPKQNGKEVTLREGEGVVVGKNPKEIAGVATETAKETGRVGSVIENVVDSDAKQTKTLDTGQIALDWERRAQENLRDVLSNNIRTIAEKC